MSEPQPRYTRVLVTVVSADGSSVTYDIKQPAGQPEVELQQEIPGDITTGRLIRREQTTFRMSVALGGDGVRAELSPPPGRAPL